jgi:hypothetical protein
MEIAVTARDLKADEQEKLAKETRKKFDEVKKAK